MMDSKYINQSVQKVDHVEKTDGSAVYIADLKLEGMLYAKTLRSTKARALIKSINAPALPDGYTIVDYHDIPGINRVKMILNDQPYFAEDRVNYIGEAILLVVGPDKQVVLDILKAIHVDYEDLMPILTLDDADRDDIEPLYEGRNYFADYHYSKGDMENLDARSNAENPDMTSNQEISLNDPSDGVLEIIEREYTTPYQEQAYLEPQGVVASYENERITVYGSLQCLYYVKNALIQEFGWPGERIRVVQTTVGGGFGGKEDYPSILAGQAACAAYKTGKPVQLILDRSEDVEVTPKRHPAHIRLKTWHDSSHRVVGLQATIRTNAGAYSSMSTVVLQRALFNIGGVYNIPNIRAQGRAVATNTVPNSAFRGFGAPQAIFAIEMHMDFLARKFGLDALEYKKMHMVRQGDLTATGGEYRHPVPLNALIDKVSAMADFYLKNTTYTHGLQSNQKYRGIAMALFMHGCGFTGSGERDHIKAVVKLRKTSDGIVDLLVAAVDMGQGIRTTLRKIVATELGIPLENVRYELPDTDRVPDSGPTVASRTVMIVGKLIHVAAAALKKRWQESGIIEIRKDYEHPSFMKWEDSGGEFAGDAYPTYSWGVNAVEVEVDALTYEVEVKGVWSAFDVGKAMDDKIMQGQIEGGICQGLGYATIEVMNSKNGKLQQRSFTDYVIPSSKDFAKIECCLIDNPYERGPFGAKGAGELPLIGAAPALAAAVGNALAMDICQIPVTPEWLLEKKMSQE
jgi:CO/xanthine dehydrogenase Mo-binding subunit